MSDKLTKLQQAVIDTLSGASPEEFRYLSANYSDTVYAEPRDGSGKRDALRIGALKVFIVQRRAALALSE